MAEASQQLLTVAQNIVTAINGLSTSFIQGGTKTGINQFFSYNYTPVYNLGFNTLAVNLLFETSGLTIPDNFTYDDIRFSQPDGTNNIFTVGNNAIVAPIYSSPEATSNSKSSSNVYGSVMHVFNSGPGNVRGVHAGGFARAGSTGFISAVGMEIVPVSTSGGAWGGSAQA